MKQAWAMIITAVSMPPATSHKEFLRGLRHKALTNALKQGRAVKLQEMEMGSAKDACNEENRRVLAWRMIDDAVALHQSIKRRDIEEGVRRAALDQALKRTNWEKDALNVPLIVGALVALDAVSDASVAERAPGKPVVRPRAPNRDRIVRPRPPNRDLVVGSQYDFDTQACTTPRAELVLASRMVQVLDVGHESAHR